MYKWIDEPWVVQQTTHVVLVRSDISGITVVNLTSHVDTSGGLEVWPERLLLVLCAVDTQPVAERNCQGDDYTIKSSVEGEPTRRTWIRSARSSRSRCFERSSCEWVSYMSRARQYCGRKSKVG